MARAPNSTWGGPADPATGSNWTGRVPRTSYEAFGSEFHVARSAPHPAGYVKIVLGVVAFILILAAVTLSF